MTAVKKQVWIKGIAEHIQKKEEGSWLNGIIDYSKYAENDVLHLTDSNISPEVLINNTTYPIPIQTFTDGDITISLDKYVTKATSITDDELYGCTYDKIATTKEKHGDSISEAKFTKALHALCPSENTVSTPILKASGEDDGTGRKRLTRTDIIALKAAFDAAKISKVGRRLVLSSNHVNDLLVEDKDFRFVYLNHKDGSITNLYGFEVYETIVSPHITLSSLKKKSYGAVPVSGDLEASVAFLVKGACKSKGSTKMYFSEAAHDPTNQRNLINFRHYFIVLPLRTEGIGAIV